MLLTFARELWIILTELAPYLFLGSFIATLLKFRLPPGFISAHLGQPSLISVMKSVFLGVPMPLCSCGVIPAAISLKKSGASNGSVVGFMISTPQTGADSLLISASFLGWPMALYMMAVTFCSGLIGGILVHWLAPFTRGKEDVRAGGEEAACSLSSASAAGPRWRQYYHYAVDELIGGVYRYLIIGILVSAAISLAVPPDALSRIPALQGVTGMLAVLAVAVPLYVCSNGSVPIAASLIRAGMPAGSALVFLMAGPATNFATIGSVYRILGRRVMLIYLAAILSLSVGAGLLYQHTWGGLTTAHVALHRHQDEAGVFQIVSALSALFLLFLMVRWSLLDFQIWLRERFNRRAAATLPELVLQVDGMTCMNCAAHLKRDLEKVPGVVRVEVNLEKGSARLWGRNLDRDLLAQAVCQAGYTLRGATCE